MREVLGGYQRGLAKLHPGDHEDRTWFTERLRDLWICTGSWSIQAAPAIEDEAGTCVATIERRRQRGGPRGVHLGATLIGMVGKPHDVLATREARAALPAMLERFRRDGADAEPVVIGARRRPEAVVLSYERYLRLAGGHEVAAALQRQIAEAGAALDPDAALELADSELHALRAERRSPRP
jgi:PHD/YefM family antitoxin component YafN of YafNO toxin-antitoxin module